MPNPVLQGLEEIEVVVDKLVAGGEGLARFEGLPIFVPRSAPGDRLRVRLEERKASYARARIVEILEPGEGRREAPCIHFDACGGCDLQHLEDAVQLRLKADAVLETLRRIGGIESPSRFEVVSGDPWGYRSRTQVQIEQTDRGPRIGYFGRGSHDLVTVEQCPVLRPQLEAALSGGAVRRGLHEKSPPRLDLSAGDDGSWTCSPPHSGMPGGEIRATVGDLVYEYDGRCFFQAHHALSERLVEHALADELVGTGAGAPRQGEAFDLYAGVGLFSLPLARRYRRVTSVDGDRLAIRFAGRNARANGLEAGVRAIGRAVEAWIHRLPEGPDRVLVDPPRAGLSAKVRDLLMARRPRWLTYVSCQPATLARDLKLLTRVFSLESLTLLDMFPQTGHMESVAQLRLRRSV
ncbi:MAG: class I SAM-dependent RNA methyltransferase [Acidobacteriota bacterium]